MSRMNKDDMATFISLHEQEKRNGIIIDIGVVRHDDSTYYYSMFANIKRKEFVIQAISMDAETKYRAEHKCEDYEEMVSIYDDIVEDAENVIKMMIEAEE